MLAAPSHGRLDVRVTGEIDLDRLGPDGLEAMTSNRKHVKTLVRTG